MKERDVQIDALKGFAIFLVILGHTIFWTDSQNYSKNLMFNLIYSFHMPLFFFISGYLTYGRFGPTTLKWIEKKFIGLIMPYIIFTLIYFFVLPQFSLDKITNEILIHYIFAYTKPDSAWFLPVLFESFIVLSFIINIEKILKKTVITLFFILFFIIFPLIPIGSTPGIFQIVYFAPYVIIGYYINKYKENLSKIKYDRVPYIKDYHLIIGTLLFPILFSLRSNSLVHIINDNFMQYFSGSKLILSFTLKIVSLLILYYSYITAFAGIIFSYFIIKNLSKSKIIYFFNICGIFSLELYLIHLIIGNYRSGLSIPIWFGSGILAIFSGTFIIITLSLCISYIISYNQKISKCLFGRWSAKYAPENTKKILYILIFITGYLYLLNILI